MPVQPYAIRIRCSATAPDQWAELVLTQDQVDALERMRQSFTIGGNGADIGGVPQYPTRTDMMMDLLVKQVVAPAIQMLPASQIDQALADQQVLNEALAYAIAHERGTDPGTLRLLLGWPFAGPLQVGVPYARTCLIAGASVVHVYADQVPAGLTLSVPASQAGLGIPVPSLTLSGTPTASSGVLSFRLWDAWHGMTGPYAVQF